jgi:hypothetical protein
MNNKTTPHIILITIVFLLLLGWSVDLVAQTAMVEGRVMSSDNKVIELANVAIFGEKGGTTTDKNGRFKLKVPANKDIIVAITYVGFADIRKKLKLKENETKVIKVILNSITTELPSFEVKDEQLRTQSMVRLNPKDAMVAPTLTEGVSDILITLPGVSSSNEMSSL